MIKTQLMIELVPRIAKKVVLCLHKSGSTKCSTQVKVSAPEVAGTMRVPSFHKIPPQASPGVTLIFDPFSTWFISSG